MMEKDAVVDTLNDLIRIVEDCHEGYRQAGESAGEAGSAEDVQSLFNDLAAQRGAIVRELQRLVAEQGGAPDVGGTMMGGAHRFFLGLKSAVLGHDHGAILGEVDRGEDECLRLYGAALARDLPLPISAVLVRHIDRIRADRDRMAALRAVVA